MPKCPYLTQDIPTQTIDSTKPISRLIREDEHDTQSAMTHRK
jgi:hypothetical protein